MNMSTSESGSRVNRHLLFALLAIRQDGDWVFNPSMQHVVHDGDVLMVMTAPQGRTRMEQLIQGVA